MDFFINSIFLGQRSISLVHTVDTLKLKWSEIKMCLKYHFQFNSKDDRFEAIVVPRSRKSRTFESEDDDEQDTDYLQYAKEKLRDGRGCLIRDEYVDTGDSIEVPELCVELICKDNTNVDVRSLHESKCRRRRNRNF